MVWTVLITQGRGFRSGAAQRRLRLPAAGLRHQGGLAPLHAWLPDAHAEGPTPISAVLSGLLLNVALYALLRFKMLLAANPAAIAPGPLMVTMGLVSLIFAAFMLYRRRDIKRLFAYSSIEHMGIIVFAFGMGGPLANFAGLLHMVMHSLTKSAIFYAVGHISQIKGTQRIADIRGLTETHPLLGWGLVLGVVAIAGLPPLGIFMSEFLVVSSTFAREPLLALPLVFGMLIGARRAVAAPERRRVRRADRQHRAGAGVLRADVRAFPRWCSRRASTCRRRSSPGSRTWRGCWADGASRAQRHDRRRARGRPSSVAARRGRREDGWRARSTAGRGRLDAARPLGRQRRGSPGARTKARARIGIVSLDVPGRALSRRSGGITRPRSASSARSTISTASRPTGLPTRGPGSITANGACSRPLGRSPASPAVRAPYVFLPAEGENPAPDPGRPGACRHHRARPFPLSPPTARPWCGSKSGSATCTRASRA